ncbi:MAG: molybdopterin-dependent oxidoreductase [Epsilonproteobacteria bacterium]|nr:molybdopterin-dependent oxidoreductase [Campylobacterota bacterium]
MKNTKTVCAYCGVGCEVELQTQDNKIIKANPVKNGYSSNGDLCIKGKEGFGFANATNRLTTNLISYKFIEKNAPNMPFSLQVRLGNLFEYDHTFYEAPFSLAVDITAWKIKEILNNYPSNMVGGIGGARTSVENAWLFQKFIRETLKSANVDNCARVCHAPSLSGLKMSIGEGASSASFDDIFKSEVLFIIGSNTTQAHPIIASRIIKAKKQGKKIIVIDVRETMIMKFADIKVILPFEANLLFLNSIAKEIISNNLQNHSFISDRCINFDTYKNEVLNETNDKTLFLKLKGYEEITSQISQIAKLITQNKTLFIWGLGITEHLDGTEAVNAISNLAMMSGNLGEEGVGVMPLRGQNNVQGCCDVGCLPYYLPDYQIPTKIGLMTPQMIEEMANDKFKALFVMGEDLTHIHTNQTKIHKAINNLELLVTLDLFINDVARHSDIVFGVKSSYEKYGVYVNAERRLHLAIPAISNDLPDDWQVIQAIENKIHSNFNYTSSEDIFNALTKEVSRFRGATYDRLKVKPLQWPIDSDGNDTPYLHKVKFSTSDGRGHFHYRPYVIREQIKNLLDNKYKFYLTTGRDLHHYNNASQTQQSQKLLKKYNDDILLINPMHDFGDSVILKSKYGQTQPLKVKYTNKVKPYTLYTTFHFAKNHINYLFGDEADEKVKTARFKSIEVEIKEIRCMTK